jgi:ubiquinone/menaquinone biosynthesis C-methylase UbiE
MPKRILNAGCWKSRYGTDFVDLQPQFPECLKCDLDRDKLPYKGNTFDEIYSWGVIGHLTNLGHFLNEAKRVLKPKGTLTVYVENAGLWGWYGMAYHGGYEMENKSWGRSENDISFTLHTPYTLKNWLLRYGFKIKELRYASGDENQDNKQIQQAIHAFY